jgi:hypothetical protein
MRRMTEGAESPDARCPTDNGLRLRTPVVAILSGFVELCSQQFSYVP